MAVPDMSKCMGETPMLRNPLYQLDIVAEWIAKMKPLVARDPGLILDRQLGGFDVLPPRGDVIDLVCHVRPRRAAIDAVLHADVHLALAGVKPESVALEHCRPGDFFHSE